MILNVYVMRDRVVGAYNKPFYDNLDREDFVETIKRVVLHDPKGQAVLRDCDLYLLGSYDDKTGKFDLLDDPDFIVSIDQFFSKEEK